jgi:MinD superfamily P-loop ATPase
MIITIASGKGGTGKTTVAVNLALSLENVQFLDCDVEAPNAHLFLHPKIEEKYPVRVPVPRIDKGRCDYCGKCAKFCEYNAIAVLPNDVMVFNELCHSCGGCLLVCPKEAITEVDREIGIIEKGHAEDIEFIHGKLNIGEPMSPPLIAKVKENIDGNKTVIIDVPPGTSCPVIESIYGSDYCLLVTEPTPFGLHDLKLAVEVLRTLKIPFSVIINQEGIGDEKVDEFCRKEKIPIALRIPTSRKIAELYSKGIPFSKEMDGWKDKFSALYRDINNTQGGAK